MVNTMSIVITTIIVAKVIIIILMVINPITTKGSSPNKDSRHPL